MFLGKYRDVATADTQEFHSRSKAIPDGPSEIYREITSNSVNEEQHRDVKV